MLPTAVESTRSFVLTGGMGRVAVLVSVAILGLAACNGGSDGDSSATTVSAVDTSTSVLEIPTTIVAPTTVAPPATTTPPSVAPVTTLAPTTVPVTAPPTTTSPLPAPTTTAPATTVAPTPATTAPCRVPGMNEIVRRGDCGDTVTFIQERLTLLGFPAAADGQFGAGTETAVKNFQSSRGLVADGIVGPLTWDKLVEGGLGD